MKRCLIFAAFMLAASLSAWGTAPALVGTPQSCSGAHTCTTAAMNTTGANLLVVVEGTFSTTTDPIAPTDSKGNSWTGLTTRTQGGNVRNRIFYSIPTSVGASHTFTVETTTSFFPAIVVMAFSGVGQTGQIDVENGSTASTATIQPGSVTPASDNSVLVTGVSMDSNAGGVPTINSGFNTPVGIAPGAAEGAWMSYLVQNPKAAINPTWTFSTGVGRATNIAVFKPPASNAPARKGSGVW